MTVVRAIQRTISLVAIGVMMSIAAIAQVRPAPTNVTALYTTGAANAGGFVTVSWSGVTDPAGNALASKYTVYQASGITDDATKFEKVGSVEHNSGNRENRYTFVVQGLKAGWYTFFVRAVYSEGDGPRSSIAKVEVKTTETPVIRFISSPIGSGIVGKPYYYQSKVEASANGPVTYKIVAGPEGMTITDGGKLVWNEPRAGRYEIVITAVVSKDGKTYDARQSYVLTITDGTNQTLKFITEPIKTGTAGIRYVYPARAGVVNGNVMPIYAIIAAPQGMVIDAKTGLLTWENPVVGKHEVVIAAKATINGVETIVKQIFALEIKEGKPAEKGCATITGTVTFDDPSTNAKLEGVVTAWRQEVVKKDNGSSTNVYRAVYRGEIKNGVYTISLPEGTYKLRVEGKAFFAEWHADALELADAKDVVIACNTTTTVDFGVKVRPEPVLVVAEGRVFDAVTNEPVKAVVVFECRSKEVGSVDDRYRVVTAETRGDGSYEAKIQSGVNYVAMVRLVATKDNAANQYLAEFWNNTNDATQATVINATANIKDINFPMDKRQPRNNGFSGTMMNHYTSAPVVGKVVAYRFMTRVGEKGDTVMTKAGAMTVETNSNGGYLFTDMEPGNYIIMGMPAGRPFIPGWMVMGQMAAKEWKGAQVVSVGDVMVAVQYDIRLDTVKGEKGKGRVRGFVYDKRGGIVNKPSDVVNSSNGVVGTLVIARDENGDIIDFAISENEGAFELSEMAIGNNTITADRLEFDPSVQSVTIDPSITERVISIGMQTVKTTTSVDVPLNDVGASINLWPNPTTGATSVRFNSAAGDVMVRIVSTTGTELASVAMAVSGGEVSIALPTAELPTGMVMVHVTNGQTAFALPLNIIR
jgi:hypothetical protein